MIYNLAQYIRNNFSQKVYVNGWKLKSKDAALTIIDNGGETQNRNIRRDHLIQIKLRNEENVTAKQNLDIIDSGIKNRYGFTLPEVNVKGIVYPEIILWRCNAIQDPSFLTVDENGMYVYGVNYIMTTQT